MKKLVILLSLLLLLTAFIGCQQTKQPFEAFENAPESGMLGKTFSDVEASFGTLEAVRVEEDGKLLFLFAKTPVGFCFDGLSAPIGWFSLAAENGGMLSGSVAVRDIPGDTVCNGVSGRLKDFGIRETAVISDLIAYLSPTRSEAFGMDVYSLELSDTGLNLTLFCAPGSKAVTGESILRVVEKGTPAAPATSIIEPITPAPTAEPTAAPTPIPTPTPSPEPTPDYETPYREAKALIAKDDYEGAIAILKTLNGYLDSRELITDCENEINYRTAEALYAKKKFQDAYPYYAALGDYKDSASQLLRCRLFPTAAGDKVIFGRFEQDDDTSEPEDIVWIVLGRTGNKRLLLSRDILTTLPFDKNHTVHGDDENIIEDARVPATWEKSSLRKWLNRDFLKTAFNEAESAMIVNTKVKNEGNSEYGIAGSKTTTDKIFLLSISEINKYWKRDSQRKAVKTDYAKNKYAIGKRYNWWWTRNPGSHTDYVAIVLSGGRIEEASGKWYGRGANNPGGVRPAMWIDLS